MGGKSSRDGANRCRKMVEGAACCSDHLPRCFVMVGCSYRCHRWLDDGRERTPRFPEATEEVQCLLRRYRRIRCGPAVRSGFPPDQRGSRVGQSRMMVRVGVIPRYPYPTASVPDLASEPLPNRGSELPSVPDRAPVSMWESAQATALARATAQVGGAAQQSATAQALTAPLSVLASPLSGTPCRSDRHRWRNSVRSHSSSPRPPTRCPWGTETPPPPPPPPGRGLPPTRPR